jgi:nucleotide-binding universal stress UspA family protein
MYKRILVPVDGSPFSEAALHEAMRLAREGGASITILSVLLDFSVDLPNVPRLEQASEQRLERYLAKLDREVRDAGLDARHLMRRGSPAREILSVSKEIEADLIVMASHGVGAAGPGAPAYGLGGVTFKVLHNTTCPVLVIPIRKEPTEN